MSSFFASEFLPPTTSDRRGLCQLQVLLALCCHASPLMPNLKTPFFEKTRFVRSLLISALIAIGYYSRATTQQFSTLAIPNFAPSSSLAIPSHLGEYRASP